MRFLRQEEIDAILALESKDRGDRERKVLRRQLENWLFPEDGIKRLLLLAS